MKKVIPVLLVLLLLCGCAQPSASETCSVTVEAVHEDGRIFIPQTTVTLSKEGTVMEALLTAAKEAEVPVVTSGTQPNRYVEGIGGLFAMDEGDLSGWLYYVNEESPSVGADSYTVSEGDGYRFLYVKDFSAL